MTHTCILDRTDKILQTQFQDDQPIIYTGTTVGFVLNADGDASEHREKK